MRYLFWNTGKNKEINTVLSEIIIEYDISFVILAEYEANIQELLTQLSLYGIHMQKYSTLGCKRITILGSVDCVKIGPQSERYSIQVVNDDEIVCCVHLPSKLHDGTVDRRIAVHSLIDDVVELEKSLNTEKTLIVGDFNENPYEDDFVDVEGFFGVPAYSEAKRRKKVIQGKEFRMFYNPMWNLFGDFEEPCGTYYYNCNGTCWNMFDQVIIRPALRNRFIDKNLQIITNTMSRTLLKRNGRSDDKYSDHLPITFELED